MQEAEAFPEREAPGDRASPEEIRFQIWPATEHSGRVVTAWPWRGSFGQEAGS